ncbi:hypothetical protein MLD38_036817 [Melastoma candidum]|uniref:Uncharacterized protein n=1 Tax=Melastoma candidum TaxID=119954 RepID=A0ACB9LKP6_9MYRT|nr:hypothetical protein MLD38_036817 [Melastoma candidum]
MLGERGSLLCGLYHKWDCVQLASVIRGACSLSVDARDWQFRRQLPPTWPETAAAAAGWSWGRHHRLPVSQKCWAGLSQLEGLDAGLGR